ncbi:MAG: hypothetical protein EZS28_003352 [Streblomastix strix]|uniref:Uncharacterized protein n=1 Tax=Streblomastix strix TaxID=222440 RepID=A0A5J4X1L1_9EUKA|nr:MAG: hypothetical protein EZS28_003352 [Streblomastix strix]
MPVATTTDIKKEKTNISDENERIFRDSIANIATTKGKSQEQLLQLILRLLTTANNEWKQRLLCTSILSVTGKMHILLDKARSANKEGKSFGGTFLIFGEKDEDEEERMKQLVMSKREQLISEMRIQHREQSEQQEIAQKQQTNKQRQKQMKEKSTKLIQIAELQQEINWQERVNESWLYESQPELAIAWNATEIDCHSGDILDERLVDIDDRIQQADNQRQLMKHEKKNLKQKAKLYEQVVDILRSTYDIQQQQIQEQEEQEEKDQMSSNTESELVKRDKVKVKVVFNELQVQKDKEKENQKLKENKKEKEKQQTKEQTQLKQKQTIQDQKQKEKIQIDETLVPKIKTDQKVEITPDMVQAVLVVLKTVLYGGIAVVKIDEEIPNLMSYRDMINLKGVVFVLPDFRNGQLYAFNLT